MENKSTNWGSGLALAGILAFAALLYSAPVPVAATNDLVVDGPMVLNGYHEYDNVTINTGGVLTHDAGYNNGQTIAGQIYPQDDPRFNNVGLYLKITGTLTINSGGGIDVSGKGNQAIENGGAGWYLTDTNNGNGGRSSRGGGGNGYDGGKEISSLEYAPGGTGGGTGGAYNNIEFGAGGGGGYMGGGRSAFSMRFGTGAAGLNGAAGQGGYGCIDNYDAPRSSSNFSNLVRVSNGQFVQASVERLIKNSGFGGAGAGNPGFINYARFGAQPDNVRGGDGGGRIVVEAQSIVMKDNSFIYADGKAGEAPPAWANSTIYSGAGGAGGTVGLISDRISLEGTAHISARGGAAGFGQLSSCYTHFRPYADGGGGGGGLVAISAVTTDGAWQSKLETDVTGATTQRVNGPTQTNGLNGFAPLAIVPLSFQLNFTLTSPAVYNPITYKPTLSVSRTGGNTSGDVTYKVYCKTSDSSPVNGDSGTVKTVSPYSFTVSGCSYDRRAADYQVTAKVVAVQEGVTIPAIVTVDVAATTPQNITLTQLNADPGNTKTFAPKFKAVSSDVGNDNTQSTAYYFFCDEPNNAAIPSTSGVTPSPNPPQPGDLESTFTCPAVTRTSVDQTKYVKVVVDNGGVGRRKMVLASYTLVGVPDPTVSVFVDKNKVAAYQTINLSWNSSLATTMSINGGSVPPNAVGTRKFNPAVTTPYTARACNVILVCVEASVTVTVPAPLYSGPDINYGQGSAQW